MIVTIFSNGYRRNAMSEELKSCPLCGPDSFIMTFTRQPLSPDAPLWTAVLKCDYCGISISGTGVTEKLALESVIEVWNTRAERTCHVIIEDECTVCSGCNEDIDPSWTACPYCGAKVVCDNCEKIK